MICDVIYDMFLWSIFSIYNVIYDVFCDPYIIFWCD